MTRIAAAWALLLLSVAARAAPPGIEPPVLRASLESEPNTLDWNAFRSGSDRYIVSFLMRGLLKYDASNRPVCDLCRKFVLSPDGRTLSFELDTAAEWSDGVALDASQFVDSLRRLLNPANGFEAAGDFAVVEGAVQPGGPKAWDPRKLAVRSEGKGRLEITLSRPQALFPHLLTTIAAYPVRKELLDPKPGGNGENHAMTAVLGPYQLAAWERGKRIVIEGNPKYRGPRPVYRVDFVLGKHAQGLAKFKAGRLDILASPTADDAMKAPGQKLQVSPYWATRTLVLNVSRKPLADAALRRALLYGLERDGLPAFLKNGDRRVTGLIPPGLPGYRALPLATADLARAQKERAGAGPGTLELKLLVRDLDSDRRVAEWLASQLGRIGIGIKPRFVDEKAYLAGLKSGGFDLALGVWSFDTASPVEILRSFETGVASNRGRWTNVGFDALLGQLTREADPAQVSALVDRTTEVLEVKDIAVIPLGYPTQPFLLGRRVVSFAVTPFGDPDLVRIELRQ